MALLHVIFLIWLVAFPTLSWSQSPETAPSNDKIVLQLKWLHQFQFAGYYAAEKNGYFKQAGLNVEIRERDLTKNNIEQVLHGDADYGIADSALLLYQAKQKPVVIVAAIFQHSPQVLITLKSSGLDSAYKLGNKRIAFYPKDTDGFSTLAMLHEVGKEGVLDRIFKKDDPAMLLRGEADAYACYITNEPYYFYHRGIPINIIKPMNYGIDMYGDMLFTTRNEIKNHPKRVEAFRQAVIKGWQYALTHKEEMAQYILDTYHPKGKTLDHLVYEANAIEDMMDVPSTEIGTLDSGRLEFIKQLFHKHGLIKTQWDISEGIYHPSHASLTFTELEKQWIERHPVVRLGIDPAWYPIDFVDDKGNFSGISSAVLDYIQHKTGIRFDVDSKLEWKETVTLAKKRELDMYSAVIKTPERESYMNFTQPYLKFKMVIAAKAGAPYLSNLNTLQQKTIAVVKDYAAHDYLKNNFPGAKLLFVSTPQAGLEAVAEGKAYGYIDNVAVIGAHIRRSGLTQLQINGELPIRADVRLAVRSDWPELLSILNKVLSHFPPQELKHIQSRYLHVDYRESFNWMETILLAIPLLIIIAFILVLNRKLITTQRDLKEKNAALEILSTTDHLTKSFNRNYLDNAIQKESARAQRYRNHLTILMFDIDHFKTINDRFGHAKGDEVLIQFTHEVQKNTRETDVFGRWGGEEFLLVCPNTSAQQAFQLAEKIRLRVAECPCLDIGQVTISVGVAEYDFEETIHDLIKRCDEAMYQAKSTGRNKSVIAQGSLKPPKK